MDKFEDAVMEDQVSNLEVTDNPDGSANITMDISEEAQVMLMKGGLQYLIDEMAMTDKVIVLSPNEFSGEAKTWELTDENRNWLFHFGFIDALKRGLSDES